MLTRDFRLVWFGQVLSQGGTRLYQIALLWWLLDKSSNQRATAALVSLTQQLLPSAALTLRVPSVRRFVISVDGLIREALLGSPVSA